MLFAVLVYSLIRCSLCRVWN